MGAEVRVTIWTADEAAAAAAAAAVFAEFDRLDALLSVWKPGSDVLRINAAAGQAPVAVSRETIEVVAGRTDDQRADGGEVRHHLRSARRPLEVRSRSGQPRADDGRDRRAAAARRFPCGARSTIAPGRCPSTRPGMRIHLGGIGKGYAVDRAVAHPARPRARRLHDAVGWRSLCARPARGSSMAAGHQRSARRAGRQLRDPRPARPHVQHVRRLRALVHEGRQFAFITCSIPTSASPRAAAAA